MIPGGFCPPSTVDLDVNSNFVITGANVHNVTKYVCIVTSIEWNIREFD
jgi:hypothetical protein